MNYVYSPFNYVIWVEYTKTQARQNVNIEYVITGAIKIAYVPSLPEL